MKYKILDAKITRMFQRTEESLNKIIELTPKEVPIYFYNQTSNGYIVLPDSKPIGKVTNLELVTKDDPYKTKAIYADILFSEYDDIKKKLLNNDFGSYLYSITTLLNEDAHEKIIYILFGPKEFYKVMSIWKTVNKYEKVIK